MTLKSAAEQSGLPKLEAEILLSAILNQDRSFIFAFPEQALTKKQSRLFSNLAARRKTQEPLAYILGYQEFYGLKFLVNKNVLIPRPETEGLVDLAISLSKNRLKPTIADVGTGSGCVAIAVAKNLPNARIFASDISKKALSVARKNALFHQINTINFIETDLLEGISEKLDLVLANLPYIPVENWEKLPRSIRDFEPRAALDSGSDKNAIYRTLFRQAHQKLKPEGKLIYELDGDIIQLSVADLVERARE